MRRSAARLAATEMGAAILPAHHAAEIFAAFKVCDAAKLA
jgi:hypothetical protein